MPFSISESEYGPGKAITVMTPALLATFTTLGASVRNVKVRKTIRRHGFVGLRRRDGAASGGDGTWVEVNNHHVNYQEAMEDCGTYIGATVGRFAGRICNGQFTLDNTVFETPKNQNGQHTIHGGGNAFDKKHWSYAVFNTEKEIGVVFSYTSPHMENGFPAELRCTTTYRVLKAKPAALEMQHDAYIPECSPADATIVNMFNHNYWNLNGVPSFDGSSAEAASSTVPLPKDVCNHILTMPLCDKVIETDSLAIPSGRVLDVASHRIFDFRKGKVVGRGILEKTKLSRDPPGFDHPFLVSGYSPEKKREAAELPLNATAFSPTTGITMQVYSTFPSVWVYTANNMPVNASGARGQRHGRYGSLCIEPQHPPDAANHIDDFPSDVFVRKGKPYYEKIIVAFSVSASGNSRL